MKLKKNTFMQGAFVASMGIVISKILGIMYVIPFYAIIGEQGGALYGYAYNIYGQAINGDGKITEPGAPDHVWAKINMKNISTESRLKESEHIDELNTIEILKFWVENG